MSWQQLDPAVLKLASQVLTNRQLQVFVMALDGIPVRAIAYHKDRSRTTISDTLDSAYRKLRAHGVRFHPDGRPYLQETPIP